MRLRRPSKINDDASPPTMDVWKETSRTRQRTAQEQPEAVQLWLAGINLAIKQSDALRDLKWDDDPQKRQQEQVLFGLLTHAVNTQLSGYVLASGGYYSQSVALVRVGLEDWVAWWYVAHRPEEAHRFLDEHARTPRFNDMVTWLDANHPEELVGPRKGQLLLDRIKELHPMAHVDSIGVRLSYHVDDGTTWLALGPHYNGQFFIGCAQALLLQLPHLVATFFILAAMCEREPIERSSALSYTERVNAWLDKLPRDLGLVEDGRYGDTATR